MRWNLRFAIQRAKRTQRDVARSCGMTEVRLSEIVNGWRNPTQTEREKLANELHKPIEMLFGQEVA